MPLYRSLFLAIAIHLLSSDHFLLPTTDSALLPNILVVVVATIFVHYNREEEREAV